MTTSSFDIGALSDTGRKRTNNEDACLRGEDYLGSDPAGLRRRLGRLYVVADGVGGNADGQIASHIVVEETMRAFYSNDADMPDDPIERLRTAITSASRAVHVEASRRNNNMASTIVVALLHEQTLYVANVGDSTALLVVGGKSARKLSTDHIRKADTGKPALAQAMGDFDLAISFANAPFDVHDVVVLCTDGLTDLVRNEEIARTIRGRNARDATRILVARANQRGGHDNVTALVVRNGRLPFLAQRSVRQSVLPIVSVLALIMLLFVLLPQLASGTVPMMPGSLGGTTFNSNNDDLPQIAPTSELLDVPTALPTATPAPTPVPVREQKAPPVATATKPQLQTTATIATPQVPTVEPAPQVLPDTPASAAKCPGGQIQVPLGLEKKPGEEAKKLVTALGFSVWFDEQVVSNDAPQAQTPVGAVLSYEPRGGTCQEKGTTITFGIRKAEVLPTVPAPPSVPEPPREPPPVVKPPDPDKAD